MTLEQLIRDATGRLGAVSATARIDANALACAVFSLTRAGLISHSGEIPAAAQRLAYQNAIMRRLDGEPVAHITGYREFWSMNLAVTTDVLIPRPETELLVEHALKHVAINKAVDIVDLGTGSGAVALAIASERPRANVVATDTSVEALAIAKANATTHGLERIEFIRSEWFQMLESRQFDLIVSNPPYVAADDPHLKQGDVRFEPVTALTAGPEGLDDLSIICKTAASRLNSGGWLVVEHGFDQGLAVRGLFEQAGFNNVVTVRDLNTNERVTKGRV